MDVVNSLGDMLSENKFTVKPAEITVSNKVATKQQRPCQHYIDITFNKEADLSFFAYITLQNFYTHAITIKQFVPPSNSSNQKQDLQDDKNWVSILKNYKLMADAHYENDAQNWHIIGVELVRFLCFPNRQNLWPVQHAFRKTNSQAPQNPAEAAESIVVGLLDKEHHSLHQADRLQPAPKRSVSRFAVDKVKLGS